MCHMLGIRSLSLCVFHLSSSALILLSMLILMKSSLRSHSDPATLTSLSLAFGGSIVAIIHTQQEGEERWRMKRE